VSHYPREIEDAASNGDLVVVGMGMNKAELDRNDVFGKAEHSRMLVDLNGQPEIPSAIAKVGGGQEGLDAATCVVSIDYLTQPLEVLSSLRTNMKKGGTVHLVISNRCFPTKAMSRWLRVDEQERLAMVGDFLYFSGWKRIEIIDLTEETKDEGQSQLTGFQALMRGMGMGGHDPLWVVRGSRDD
jgi:hypothetical protein